MARIVPAAVQLITQLEDSGRKFKTTQGDPDGLGVVRAITFDATTSRWLTPILDAIGDQRIRSITHNGRHRATVTFVPDYRADFKTPFPLNEVDAILND